MQQLDISDGRQSRAQQLSQLKFFAETIVPRYGHLVTHVSIAAAMAAINGTELEATIGRIMTSLPNVTHLYARAAFVRITYTSLSPTSLTQLQLDLKPSTMAVAAEFVTRCDNLGLVRLRVEGTRDREPLIAALASRPSLKYLWFHHCEDPGNALTTAPWKGPMEILRFDGEWPTDDISLPAFHAFASNFGSTLGFLDLQLHSSSWFANVDSSLPPITLPRLRNLLLNRMVPLEYDSDGEYDSYEETATSAALSAAQVTRVLSLFDDCPIERASVFEVADFPGGSPRIEMERFIEVHKDTLKRVTTASWGDEEEEAHVLSYGQQLGIEVILNRR